MAVNVSTVSNPLWTTIAVDTDADLDLETFNDANTTLYALEIVNPNGKAVWARFNWANSGGSTSTQNDNIFYCPANSECSYYIGSGYAITAGIRVWCSTEKGLGGGNVTLNAPTEKVTIKMAFKDT